MKTLLNDQEWKLKEIKEDEQNREYILCFENILNPDIKARVSIDFIRIEFKLLCDEGTIYYEEHKFDFINSSFSNPQEWMKIIVNALEIASKLITNWVQSQSSIEKFILEYNDSKNEVKKRYVSWAEYNIKSNLLAKKLQESKLHFDIILAIGRGGFPLATILSHQLDLPMSAIITKSYKGAQREQVDISKIARLESLEEKSILLVDDIADSGSTLCTLLDTLTILKQVYVAVLFKKSAACLDRKIEDLFINNKGFAVEEVDDKEWIVFPYEKG